MRAALVEFVREDNCFFRLSAYQERLLELYDAEPCTSSAPRRAATRSLSFVKGGLRDLSMSRANVHVGHPAAVGRVAHDVRVVRRAHQLHHRRRLRRPGRGGWLEARWPAQVHFVGKDIIRFHCVIWPAMLMAAGLPVPESVFAHGFLLTKGEKMSKSKGNVMAPAELVAQFGVDAYRYYFLRDVQFGADGSISLESMVQRYNGDLANDWGNLCSRLFNMVGKYFDGAGARRRAAIDRRGRRADERPRLRCPSATRRAMRNLDYAGALDATWDLVKATNRYIEDSAPWNLAKAEETRPRLATVLYNALEAVRIAALFTAPVMPDDLGRGLAAARARRYRRGHRPRCRGGVGPAAGGQPGREGRAALPAHRRGGRRRLRGDR